MNIHSSGTYKKTIGNKNEINKNKYCCAKENVVDNTLRQILNLYFTMNW